VTAKQSWLNGLSANDDYRTVVFAIYSGHTKPNNRIVGGGHTPPKEIWSGYYIIEELTKASKPGK
jgi:hypothetical protein